MWERKSRFEPIKPLSAITRACLAKSESVGGRPAPDDPRNNLNSGPVNANAKFGLETAVTRGAYSYHAWKNSAQ